MAQKNKLETHLENIENKLGSDSEMPLGTVDPLDWHLTKIESLIGGGGGDAPVTDVQVDGESVLDGTVAKISLPPSGTKLYRHDITLNINLPYPLSGTEQVRINNYISKEKLDTKSKFLAQMCANSVQFDYPCNLSTYASFMTLSIRLRSDMSNYCLVTYLEIDTTTQQVTALKSVSATSYTYSATITEL